MSSPLLWSLGLGLGVCLTMALLYRSAWKDAEQEARAWERRARAAGWCPPISPDIATRIMADIFAPSTVRDVAREREWRERRALQGIDHHTRHFAEGVTASEWARECMTFCIGGVEVIREEDGE